MIYIFLVMIAVGFIDLVMDIQKMPHLERNGADNPLERNIVA